MKTKRYITFGLAPWSSDGKPPTRFRLFKYGENRSTKGTVYLTRESAKKCLSNWIDYGNDISGDYNHAITNPNIENARASFWCNLALEADGLYAVNVKYTEAAHAAIVAKEYRYYSPYFAIETDKHNRPCVVEIINIALTNTPATKNQRPLVALSKLAQWSQDMMSQEQIDALKALFTEKGGPEEAASDFVLSAMALLGGGMEEAPSMEEMPLADPMPEEKKEEAMGMEEYQALSLSVAELKKTVAGLQKEIADTRAVELKREGDAKEALFAQFKREGRLRFTKEDAARKILNTDISLFKETFGAVAPVTNVKAPSAPALKSVIEQKTVAFNSVAPLFSSDDVERYAKENKVDLKTAMLSMSRAQKGR